MISDDELEVYYDLDLDDESVDVDVELEVPTKSECYLYSIALHYFQGCLIELKH